MRPASSIIGASLLACLTCGAAQASVTAGTIIGVFGGINTAGYVLNSPSAGQTTFLDNTGTSVSTVVNSTNPTTAGNPPVQTAGSVLTWGDTASGSGQASTIVFSGAVLPADVGTEFLIGRMTFVNGTSSQPSAIFGATISFYAGSVSTANFLGSDDISISSTTNLGANTSQDADYLNVCGRLSNVCNTSIAAIEASQGGVGVTFDLRGTVVGDPELFINAVQLAPNQSPTMNGFLGNDPPIGLLPEPGTLALLGSGLLGLAYRRRQAR